VLADPAARELSWTAQALPYAPPADTSGAQRRGTASSEDGVFVEDAGALDGLVSVQLTGPALPAQAGLPLTTTGQPDLVDAAALVVPAGRQHQGELSGQSQWQEDDPGVGGALTGAYSAQSGLRNEALHGQTERWRVQVDCYGGGRLQVTALGRRGSVSCDGQEHSPFPDLSGPQRESYGLGLTGDGLLAYRVLVSSAE